VQVISNQKDKLPATRFYFGQQD